jgi:hypothetical protein
VGDPAQEIVPVYPISSVIVVAGVSPVMGALIEMALCFEIVVGAAGNTAVITPEFAE